MDFMYITSIVQFEFGFQMRYKTSDLVFVFRRYDEKVKNAFFDFTSFVEFL